MAILLWTWQGYDFDPLRDRLDRSKSDFLRMDVPGCPDIRQAYADLDKLLCLPKDKEHQFVFCLTVVPETNWYKARLWRLDVPQDSILAFLDNPRWLHLIGDRSLPDSLRDQLDLELRSQKITPKMEQWKQEFSRKESEYYESFGSREACKKKLRIPPGSDKDILALLPLPLDASWVRS